MPENGMMNSFGNGTWLFFILLIFLLGGGNGFGNNGSVSNESLYVNTKLDGLAQCCCEQKLQACENKNEIINAINSSENRINALQNSINHQNTLEKLNECRNALALSNQTQILSDRFGTWYSNPCCFPCQVNNGSMCGC